MRLTTRDTSVSTDQSTGSSTGAYLRDAAKRVAKEQEVNSHNAEYYEAKERLYENLADLQKSGYLRETILLGIAAEAREVISKNPPPSQLKVAVARLEIVIELRGTPICDPEP